MPSAYCCLCQPPTSTMAVQDRVGDVVLLADSTDRRALRHFAKHLRLAVARDEVPDRSIDQPGETALIRIGANSTAKARTRPSSAALTAATTEPRGAGR